VAGSVATRMLRTTRRHVLTVKLQLHIDILHGLRIRYTMVFRYKDVQYTTR